MMVLLALYGKIIRVSWVAGVPFLQLARVVRGVYLVPDWPLLSQLLEVDVVAYGHVVCRTLEDFVVVVGEVGFLLALFLLHLVGLSAPLLLFGRQVSIPGLVVGWPFKVLAAGFASGHLFTFSGGLGAPHLPVLLGLAQLGLVLSDVHLKKAHVGCRLDAEVFDAV